LKIKAFALIDPVEKTSKSVLIDATINRLDGDLRIVRLKQSSETAFTARADWYEHGEKSYKYFLNLNKKYAKPKAKDNIKCDGVQYHGQEEVSKGITEFYQKLSSLKRLIQMKWSSMIIVQNYPKLQRIKWRPNFWTQIF
jgi:hypothetical protein